MNDYIEDSTESGNLYVVTSFMTVVDNPNPWGNIVFFNVPPCSSIILLEILEEFPDRQFVVLTSFGVMYVYEHHFFESCVHEECK